MNDAGQDRCTEGIVHFRTLDWEMDPLERLTICVEYVREGRVIARYVCCYLAWEVMEYMLEL